MLVYIGLIIVLIFVLLSPLLFRKVEENLEIFFLIMGFLAVIITSSFNLSLLLHILGNPLIYSITIAVFSAGLLFRLLESTFIRGIRYLTVFIPASLLVFLLVTILGFFSSVITAIIASLILAECVKILPFGRKEKIIITVAGCFSIGMGAVLTPIGEPLSTISITKMNESFWYLAKLTGPYIILGIILSGLYSSFTVTDPVRKLLNRSYENQDIINMEEAEASRSLMDRKSFFEILLRSIKVFIFIFALELLGTGFSPMAEYFLIDLPGPILYWTGLISAVLDNATLAAAELTPGLSSEQVRSILMGLIISGGMMIPGNIPNIIASEKIGIKSREWVKYALPFGLFLLILYFILLFVL